ncbi:MAG: ATP-binding protein, partial [Myxococcota bacterium]
GRIVLHGHALEGEGRFYLAVMGALSVGFWVAFRFALKRWRWIDPVGIGFLAQNSVAAVGALHVGAMGDLTNPFFFAVYTLPSLQIGIPMGLRWRVAYALSGSLTWSAVYFGLHPRYLEYPMLHTPAVCLLGITAASLTLGHMSYRQMREAFMLGRQLARQQLQLQSYASVLEKEVDERSEAVADLSRQLAHTSANRQGLARALHDDLGQLIVAVRMELDLLERTANRVREGAQLEHVGLVVQTLDRSVRRFIERLRSPVPLRSLRDEIETLVHPLRHRFEVEMVIAEELALTDPHGELVYRFIQEAITNVVKHAEATSVVIEVAIDDRGVTARVEDDGSGFSQKAESGWGLRGMRERATAASGAIEVKTGPAGTRVCLTFPHAHRASA